MQISCTENELLLFRRIAEAAAGLQVEAYVIGGFVRDKLIGRPTNDADIVCVGNAIELAHQVAASFSPKPVVSFFKNFGTAHINVPDPGSVTGILDVEFVGARKES
ncbi:MAG: tRNA nucleotidyltransferase, partial [Chitinophagales bacterium]